jgi:hypothetical protein
VRGSSGADEDAEEEEGGAHCRWGWRRWEACCGLEGAGWMLRELCASEESDVMEEVLCMYILVVVATAQPARTVPSTGAT